MENIFYIALISDLDTPVEGLDQLTYEEAINWMIQNGDIMIYTIRAHS